MLSPLGGLHGKVFGSGGHYRGGVCEKLDASPVSQKASVSQVQDKQMLA